MLTADRDPGGDLIVGPISFGASRLSAQQATLLLRQGAAQRNSAGLSSRTTTSGGTGRRSTASRWARPAACVALPSGGREPAAEVAPAFSLEVRQP
jgi:hypothetical protein